MGQDLHLCQPAATGANVGERRANPAARETVNHPHLPLDKTKPNRPLLP